MYYTYSAYAFVAYRRDGKLFQDKIESSAEFKADWALNEWLSRKLDASLKRIREDHLQLVAILVAYHTTIHIERSGKSELWRVACELRRPGHDPIVMENTKGLDAMLICWSALIG